MKHDLQPHCVQVVLNCFTNLYCNPRFTYWEVEPTEFSEVEQLVCVNCYVKNTTCTVSMKFRFSELHSLCVKLHCKTFFCNHSVMVPKDETFLFHITALSFFQTLGWHKWKNIGSKYLTIIKWWYCKSLGFPMQNPT